MGRYPFVTTAAVLALGMQVVPSISTLADRFGVTPSVTTSSALPYSLPSSRLETALGDAPRVLDGNQSVRVGYSSPPQDPLTESIPQDQPDTHVDYQTIEDAIIRGDTAALYRSLDQDLGATAHQIIDVVEQSPYSSEAKKMLTSLSLWEPIEEKLIDREVDRLLYDPSSHELANHRIEQYGLSKRSVMTKLAVKATTEINQGNPGNTHTALYALEVIADHSIKWIPMLDERTEPLHVHLSDSLYQSLSEQASVEVVSALELLGFPSAEMTYEEIPSVDQSGKQTTEKVAFTAQAHMIRASRALNELRVIADSSIVTNLEAHEAVGKEVASNLSYLVGQIDPLQGTPSYTPPAIREAIEKALSRPLAAIAQKRKAIVTSGARGELVDLAWDYVAVLDRFDANGLFTDGRLPEFRERLLTEFRNI